MFNFFAFDTERLLVDKLLVSIVCPRVNVHTCMRAYMCLGFVKNNVVGTGGDLNPRYAGDISRKIPFFVHAIGKIGFWSKPSACIQRA